MQQFSREASLEGVCHLVCELDACLNIHRGLFLVDSASLGKVPIQVECEPTYYINKGWQDRCLQFICNWLKFQVLCSIDDITLI
jgi:hypothetical protein